MILSMDHENRGPGRPRKAPDEKLSQRLSIQLTPHQSRVVYAMAKNLDLTAPEMVRALIRDKYKKLIEAGMSPVAKEGSR